MLQHAFKEWAVICQALAEGRQGIILRKGGIEEETGEFTLEHTRFWLFPTYLHQRPDGLKQEALPLLERVEKDRPPGGIVRLSHFAEVAGIYHLHDMVGVQHLTSLHIWSHETVSARFAYRSPGLYVLPVRIYQSPQVFELPDLERYAGCRTWVELEHALPTDDAKPVMSDETFRDLLRTLDVLLNPTALV